MLDSVLNMFDFVLKMLYSVLNMFDFAEPQEPATEAHTRQG